MYSAEHGPQREASSERVVANNLSNMHARLGTSATCSYTQYRSEQGRSLAMKTDGWPRDINRMPSVYGSVCGGRWKRYISSMDTPS